MSSSTPIDDPDDPRLTPFRSLRTRTEAGEAVAIADGLRVIEQLITSGATLTACVTTENDESALAALFAGDAPPTYRLSREVASKLVGYRYHGGVMAAVETPSTDRTLDQLGSHVVALGGLEKGDNVGAIVRSARGLGWSGLLLDRAGASPFERVAIRVSRGTTVTFPTRSSDDFVGDLKTLAEEGAEIIAADLDGTPLAEWAARPAPIARTVLLLGREGEGLSEELRAIATETVSIPLSGGVESLNVAAAAAILLHAGASRRPV